MQIDWLVNAPIAHRGLHSAARGVPENSLAAFSAATRQGYAIELDVHLLEDGDVVVFHDDDLERMTGVAGPVAKLGRQALDGFRLAGSEEPIPTFDRVLSLVDGGVPLLIEIKNSGSVGPLEGALAGLLRGYHGPVAVQSFNPFSLAWFRRHAPGIARGQLAGDLKDSSLPYYKKALLKRLAFNALSRPHFVAFQLDLLPFWAASRFRRPGRPLLAWTARSHREHFRASAFADNVIFEGYQPPA